MTFATLGTQILHGVDPIDGVKWVTQRDKCNVFSSPASTVQVAQRPRSNGAWSGSGYLAARHITLGGLIEASSVARLEDAIDRLHAACSLDFTTLVIDSASARAYQVKREDQVLIERLSPTIAAWSIQMVAPDPRRFGPDVTASTALPSSTGGLTVPFTIPFSINAVTVTGQVTLYNPGNIAGPVKLRIAGPVTGPVVTHVGTGRQLILSSSIVLGVGEWIDVDAEKRTVLANGQSSRSGWVTSRGWPLFLPGLNTYSFSAASYNAAALLTVTATPSWM